MRGKANISLKLGSIPLAKNAICVIDEIDAFSIEEQGRFQETMQEGMFHLEKNGQSYNVDAPTTLIATANPNNGGRWSDPNSINLNEINIRPSLRSRFPQIYVFKDLKDDELDEFTELMSIIRRRKPHNYNYLSKYLAYASEIVVHTVTPEAEFMLNDFWKKGKRIDKFDNRMAKGLFSIAEAHAKLHLNNIVDAEIAMEVMESMQLMLFYISFVIPLIQNPKDAIRDGCVNILSTIQT